jgi:hypothetical protein
MAPGMPLGPVSDGRVVLIVITGRVPSARGVSWLRRLRMT